MVVDQDMDFQNSLKHVLESQSYGVISAGNRSQAEAAVCLNKPDLIILGTILPRGTAFHFHHWLKQDVSLCDVPIVVIDARPEERLLKGWSQAEGMRCEADEFLCKPIEIEALVSRIEKLLDRVTKRIKVLVVDDHGMVRDGIRAVLSVQRDMQVIGEAANGKDALEKTIELSPDVVLMDIVMPVMNGLDAARQICRECPWTKVLILTQYDDNENIMASEQVGAMGFIPKASVSSRLLTGIRTVNEGKRFITRNHSEKQQQVN